MTEKAEPHRVEVWIFNEAEDPERERAGPRSHLEDRTTRARREPFIDDSVEEIV